MKKIALAVAAAAIAVPAVAAPGDTDTAQGTATATIVAPVELIHTDGAALHFGTITAGNGGTVTVALDGSVTDNGDDAVMLAGSLPTTDEFELRGDAGRAVTVTTGGGSLTGPGTAMTFTTTNNAPAVIAATGSSFFDVGGTLTVGDTQTAGDYTGSYTATATYN